MSSHGYGRLYSPSLTIWIFEYPGKLKALLLLICFKLIGNVDQKRIELAKSDGNISSCDR